MGVIDVRNCFIVLLVWKCNETNSKLLFKREKYFSIVLMGLDPHYYLLRSASAYVNPLMYLVGLGMTPALL